MRYKYQKFITFFDQGLNEPDWTLVGFSNDKTTEEDDVHTSIAHCAEAGEAFDELGLSPKEMADKIKMLRENYNALSVAINDYWREQGPDKSIKLTRMLEASDLHRKILLFDY